MSRWYRAYEGTVTDAKLGEVALVAEVSRSVSIAVWHSILESASTSNQGGRFDTTARRVSVILCEPAANIEAVFSALTDLDLIKNGVVVAWSKRQYESDSSTERSRKSRERQKPVAVDTCNADATLQQQHATPSDTDTEVDTEVDNPQTPFCDTSSKPLPDETIAALDAWNIMAGELNLPRAQRLTPKRKSSLKARLAECGGLDGWAIALSKVRDSPFLRGQKSDWRANFDFLLQQSSFTKVMEGQYDASGSKVTPKSSAKDIIEQFLNG